MSKQGLPQFRRPLVSIALNKRIFFLVVHFIIADFILKINLFSV